MHHWTAEKVSCIAITHYRVAAVTTAWYCQWLAAVLLLLICCTCMVLGGRNVGSCDIAAYLLHLHGVGWWQL
jgi:hypothetical protein